MIALGEFEQRGTLAKFFRLLSGMNGSQLKLRAGMTQKLAKRETVLLSKRTATQRKRWSWAYWRFPRHAPRLYRRLCNDAGESGCAKVPAACENQLKSKRSQF